MARQLGARAGSTGSVALAGTVLAVATLLIVVFFAQVPIANPNVQSSSRGSSSVSSSSSSATVQPAAQAAASQYPLVWGPNSPTEGGCDTFPFCIYARLGFSGTAAQTPSASSATTIIQGNVTTIMQSSTTTIISGISTGVVYPPENGSYPVAVFAFVQDAVTGQNATLPGGGPVVASGCYIQPTGYSQCEDYAPWVLPSGHYKVTVYITKGDLPCSIRPAGTSFPCTSQLLAPSQTFTFAWG